MGDKDGPSLHPSDKFARLRGLVRPPPSWLDWEFSMNFLGRPTSVVLVALIERFWFITPNHITLAAFLCLLVASGLMIHDPTQSWTIAALLFARMVLDDSDGMLARFRGQTSRFGSYLDKVTDAIGFLVLGTAVGIRAYYESHSVVPLIASEAGAFSVLLMGYVKHVAQLEETLVKRPVPAAHVADRFPPWPKFVFGTIAHLAIPMESDLVMAAAVAAVIGRYEWLAWTYLVVNGLGALIQVFRRGKAIETIDREVPRQ